MAPTEQRPKETKLISNWWAVLDRNGVLIRVPSERIAKQEAKLWNKQNGNAAPHRAVEVLLRELP